MSTIDPNGVRFDPARSRGHVESYFLKINDPARPRALWVKATILHRRGTPGDSAIAEAWAVVFDRERGHTAHKTTTPIALAHFGAGPSLDVEVAGCSLSSTRARGSLGDLAWDLELAPHAPPLFLYRHPRMYTGKLPSQKNLSPIPDLTASGTLRVRGETWDLTGSGEWRGSLGHNWGTRHTHLYAWGQISAWDGVGVSPENASDLIFEGATARVAIGPLVMPPLTVLSVRWRGVRYEWNALADVRKNKAAIHDFRRWSFSGESADGTIEGELEADTNDFVGLRYENPNGKMTHCLNSKLARARIRLEVSGRAPFEATSRAAAFEIGTHNPKHGVTMVA